MRAEAFLDTLFTLVHQVVQVCARLHPRLERRIDVADPGDLLVVLPRVWPLTEDVDGPFRSTPAHRRRVVRHAVDCSPERLDDDGGHCRGRLGGGIHQRFDCFVGEFREHLGLPVLLVAGLVAGFDQLLHL